MKTRNFLLASALLPACLIGVGSDARAATASGLLPAAMAAVVQSESLACSTPPNPATGPSEPLAIYDKAAAILGGQGSRLDLIARQQSGSRAANERDASLSAPTVGRLGFATGCQGFVVPNARIPFARGAIGSARRAPDDFLGSKRLPISRTSFDASWNRVRREALPRGTAAAFIGGGAEAPSVGAVAAINQWANQKIRYVEDQALYGRADYWASAGATLGRRAGDCEDIAIVKMQVLAAMGVARSDMYLTIARDLVRNADHAVLVVKLGDRHWLLDNATDRLLDAADSHDYRPIMSFNNGRKWLHGY